MALSTVIACTVYAFINGWKLSLVVLAFIPLLVVASAIQMRVFAGGKVSDHGEDELVQSGKVRFTYILLQLTAFSVQRTCKKVQDSIHVILLSNFGAIIRHYLFVSETYQPSKMAQATIDIMSQTMTVETT